VQTIIVNSVSIVDPQLAPVIGDQLKVVMARPEYSQAACPTHSKVITAGEARPFATRVTIVHNLAPASHVRSAAIQVLAPATLTKVEGILHEDTMPISGAMGDLASPTCTHNSPSVASVGTMVPEQHAGMTATLKHFKPDQTQPSMQVPPGLTIAPSMQAIVVYCVSIVYPQLASIIGNNAEVVMASPEDPQAASPTHSKVIVSRESRPPATCVTVVNDLAPSSHVRPATAQILAAPALPEVEGIFSEETMAISGWSAPGRPSAACLHNSPSVSSVGTMVPEQHASMTTTLKHL